MFSTCFRFSLPRLVFKSINYKMANNDKVTLLEQQIFRIERTISTLSSEVLNLKKILKEVRSGSSESSVSVVASKKRKLSTKVIDIPDSCSSINLRRDENNFFTDDNGFVHVYTDGACENNGKYNAKAGLGVWFGHDHPMNAAEPVKRRATNNVGEIEACTRAIQIANSAGVKKLLINTDSEFTINCITKWIHGWKKRNWINASGKPVINKDELIELDQTMRLMDEVKWNHVRGHHGIEGNEAADELARQGAARYKMYSGK